jgi:hypothetical protein
MRSTAQFPGASARRATGGVVPSTPGSSPIKLKEESLRSEEDEEDEDIYGDQPLIPRYSPELPDTSIPLADEEDDEIILETEEMQVDAEEDEEEEAPVGAETQAFFDADDEEEDLSVPNIEFQTPVKRTPKKRAGSKFLEDPQGWVEEKARRYDVETELVYWVLERTTGRHKLALKALKHFQKENCTCTTPPACFAFFAFVFP